ncbi:glycosyltransferase [Paenibacillus sp. DMB5]|uniref:glycosyltransferase family 2 protein n=1 Tax=Paenibacillus sp. DMB5 TaxID=1780103 RepID=UPI00076CE648|nr:glycosyltransferase [Paenibacillus sp. DMB5]KUP22638.1 hypothetical protein AWJ19_33850 [Paenibacillus sp. DMB5]
MISVIIPVFNVDRFIEKCLNSFAEQVYQNFEIVIINDGSTDQSALIIQEYINRSNMRIRLINQKNSGVSVARNKGIDEALGEYICFVDADDLVTPNYLDRMLDVITTEKCDLVFCGYKQVTEDFSEVNFDNKSVDKGQETINSNEALRKFLYNDFVTGIWSLMVGKSLIHDNTIRFSEGFRYSEDLEFIWKLLSDANSVTLIKDQLYIYRIRNGSAMSFVDSRRLDGYTLIQRLDKYFEYKCPDFSLEFKKYGQARWVWATLWQTALSCNSFKQFSDEFKKYNSRELMSKLITYPKVKVSLTALIFCITPVVYYYLLRLFGERFLYGRKLNEKV